jgi:dihydrofolate synthase/folylpolyglutamate synthase
VGFGLTQDVRYRDALDFLYARTTGAWKLGLERVDAFLGLLGNPHRDLQTIHVAGTNGKGSVCACAEAILRERGLRVGKYTSPHLVDFRERFLVNGIPVAPERIVEFIHRWTPEVERLGATFFEATTAMAFQFFHDEEVDIAVIETGLGGRLDATNVVRPLVAGVTNIGIDHVEYLGNTLSAIASEKAGIFKSGIPAIIGEPDTTIAGELARRAQGAGAAPIVRVYERGAPSAIRADGEGTTFRFGDAEWFTPLVGAHQAANAAVALAMIEQLPASVRPSEAVIRAGLGKAWLPGRFHRVGQFIFDVAHNPAGAEVLASTLRLVSDGKPVVAVLSVLGDKDWRGIMRALAPVVSRFVLTVAPTSPASRTWDLPEPMAYARENGWPAVLIRDFGRAIEQAAEGWGTVLITGSFHTVGDAMARLEVSPTAP